MSAQLDQAAAPSRSRTTRKRVRALLAGGLVLGVGAAVTLAAWNDSEFATATFGAGTFNLEGSTTAAAAGFADHVAAPGQNLVFTTPINNLSPGSVVYSPLWVRLAANTTAAATLRVASLDSTDTTLANSAQLGYAVYALPTNSTACDATAVTGLTALATATTLADNPAVTSTTTALAAGTPVTQPGASVKLCIVVSASAGLQQSGQTTASWQFAATSTP